MSTVRDLIYLNRDLRKQLQAGLSAHPVHSDVNLWPILYLAVKIMRHHEALELIAGREFGSEAGILLRSMFEATLNLLWISHDVEGRLKRYTAYQLFDSQKYRDAATKWDAMANLSEADIKQLEQEFEKLSQEASKIQDKYGFEVNEHWSGKSIKAMAKEVGWAERYDLLYRIYSDIAHSNIIASNDYISINESGKMKLNSGLQVEHCKTCLCEAYLYLWTAFSVLDTFLDLGMETVLEKAFLHMPKM